MASVNRMGTDAPETVAVGQGRATVHSAPTQTLPEETVAVLLDRCENAEQGRRRIVGRSTALGNVCLFVFVAGLSAMLLFGVLTVGEKSRTPLVCFYSAMAAQGVGMLLGNYQRSRRFLPVDFHQTVVTLTKSDDPRTLNPLIDALTTRDAATTTRIAPALTARLWTVGDDALFLDDTRRATLRADILSRYPYGWPQRRRPESELLDAADLTMAEMKCLALAADPKARRVLRAVLAAPAETANQLLVRDIAAECLSLLESRVAEQNADAKRLRALLRLPGDHLDPTVIEPVYDALGPERFRLALVALWPRCRRRNLVTLGASSFIVSSFLAWKSFGLITRGLTASESIPLPFRVLMWLTIPEAAVPLIAVLYRFRSGKVPVGSHERTLLLHLTQDNDPRLLGTLLELHAAGVETRDAPLTALLTDVRPGDSARLTPAHRAAVRRLLRRRAFARNERRTGDPRLLAAALDALAAVGDARTLPLAEKIAARADRQLVRDAAARCAERLRAADILNVHA